MPAKTTAKLPKKISYQQLHFFIWGMVFIILILSLFINQRLSLLQLLAQSGQVADTAPNLTAVFELKLSQDDIDLTGQTLEIGQTYTAEIILQTNGKNIIGADAYLEYDPQVLKIISIDQGDVFPTYPNLDFSAQKGIISVSGIMPMEQQYAGQGLFAKINFQPLKTGQADFTFRYSPSQTDDSNIIQLGTADDILLQPENLILTIQ